jgi:mannose-6-phosphate isomerase-like protein (cupin superfamily)
MRAFVIKLGLCVLVIAGVTLLAQAPADRPPGTYKSAAQIAADLDKSVSTLGMVAGQSVAIVPEVVVRRRKAGPNNASVHTKEGDGQDVTEIYEIVDGAGTIVTGGTMPDPNNRTAGIKGGESHRVTKGDFVVIPAGTPHWFSNIEGSVTYVETRIPTKK